MNLSRIAKVATIAVLTATSAFGLWAATGAGAVEQAVSIPAPGIDLPQSGTEAKAVFAGGCFWGVQGVFQHVKGVKNAVSGYAGGDAATAFYEAVGSG